MDKDTFETKLREARRQKSQVEEELESVSERWRAERRRLNSEIDRLEGALAEAKDVRKKTLGSKVNGIDPVEVAKMTAAADDRVKKAEKEFESEREKLRNEVSRLQRAVAELIERSNNPMRSTEPIKEQFQAQLEEAFKAKQHVEEEFYRARLSWEEEKLKTTGEIFKLKRGSTAKSVKGKPDDEDRVTELEKRLEETSRNRDVLKKQLEEQLSAQEVHIKQLTAKIADLEKQLTSDGRKTMDEARATELEKRLDEAGRNQDALKKQLAEAKALNSQLEAAGKAADEHKDSIESDSARERRRIEIFLKEASIQLEESNESRARLESQLKEAHAQRLEEKSNYEAELQQLQRRLTENNETVSTDVVDQLRKQYDDKLQEMIREKTQLSEDLRNASSMLDEERSRFATAAASPQSAAPGNIDGDTINAELTRVEKMIGEIANLIDDPATELSTVIRKNVERAELDAYLKGILFSMGRNRGL